jgi:hypothetical protein
MNACECPENKICSLCAHNLMFEGEFEFQRITAPKNINNLEFFKSILFFEKSKSNFPEISRITKDVRDYILRYSNVTFTDFFALEEFLKQVSELWRNYTFFMLIILYIFLQCSVQSKINFITSV